ncbi:hypothetical protein OKW42_008144 [Paraburkholderia sp. WC7.3d]
MPIIESRLNPRSDDLRANAASPFFRPRKPRDGKMKCGNQPTDMSLIHRR